MRIRTDFRTDDKTVSLICVSIRVALLLRRVPGFSEGWEQSKEAGRQLCRFRVAVKQANEG